jgi:hypothetical protein
MFNAVYRKSLYFITIMHDIYIYPTLMLPSLRNVIIYKLCSTGLCNYKSKLEVKQSHYRPWQALRVPGGWGSQVLRQSAHEGGKVVSPMHRPPLPLGNIPGIHFCWRLSRPQGHSAAGRIMSMKNSNDTITNRSCVLPVCRTVPQPTAPLCAPILRMYKYII